MDTILYSAISGIAGIVIGAVIDHVLYGSKVRKEQKSKILSNNTQERVEAVKQFKKLISELNKIEILSIAHPEECGEGKGYCFIFNNWKTLNEFADRYRTLRNKSEELLNIRCLMCIILGDKYLWDLQKMQCYFTDENLYILGIFFTNEIEKWKRKTIDKLNKFLNKPPLKFQSKDNLIYKIRLRFVMFKYHQSVLYKELLKETKMEKDDMQNAFEEIDNKLKEKIEKNKH
jgi:hypothetical protein